MRSTISKDSAKDTFANLHWTCPHCGRELKRITRTLFGASVEVPCYGSCGCDDAKFDGLGVQRADRDYAMSGIPRRYLGAATENARLAYDVQAGTSVYIFGPNGTGKTTLACAVAKQLIDMGVSVRFENSKRVIGEIQESFSGRQTDVLERCTACKVLVLDDLGKEQPTPYSLSMLYQVIDSRYAASKPTVVTSNFSRGALVNRWEQADLETAEAIASRLCEDCEVIQLDGEDRRLG